MKKTLITILAAVSVTVAVPSLFAKAKDTENGTVTVSESCMLRKADPEILGVGSEWGNSFAAIMRSAESTEFSDEFMQAAKTIHHMPLARTAGDSLNRFFWKNSIGAFGARKTPGAPYSWFFSQKCNVGPIEWVNLNKEIDSSCQFIVGVNIYTESPKLNGEYAEFLTGDADKSELAALRVQCGVIEPVKVFAYELGNEMDVLLSPEEYCERAKKAITAIRAKDPNAKFIACGKTYPMEYGLTGDAWRNWHKTILSRMGDEIDYISFHAYYDGVSTADQEKYLDIIKADIKSVTSGDRIKLVITEQAKWDAAGDDVSNTNTLIGCLSTADFLNRMYNRTDVAGANYYLFPGTLNGQWGFMGKGDNEEAWYLSGIGKLYNEYSDRLGDYVLKSDLQMSSSNMNEKVSVLAMTKNGDEMQLVIANKLLDSDVSLSLRFEYNYTLTSESIFTADSPTARVLGQSTKDAMYTVTTAKNVSGFNRYTVPAKSVVFLTLRRSQTMQRDNNIFTTGDDMESYMVTDEFLSGGGKTLGAWTTSSKYNGWQNSTKMKAAVYDGNKVLMAMGGANPSCRACINYTGDRIGLSAKHTASIDVKQTHWSFDLGLRTMVHDNEASYYELVLKPDYSYALFRKVNAGKVEYERVIRPPAKRGPGYNKLKIVMNGNEIYYSIKTNGDVNWSSGIYYDPQPFELSGNSAGIALNVSGDQGYVYADNFEIHDNGAESNFDFSKRSGTVAEYLSDISKLASEYDNAVNLNSVNDVKEAVKNLVPPLLEYESYIIDGLSAYEFSRLSEKLISRGPIGVGNDFTAESADELKRMITDEAILTLAESCSAPTDIKNNLEGAQGRLRINLNDENYVSHSDDICTAMIGKTYTDTDDFRLEFKKQCALSYLKSASVPEELCIKISEWEFIGYDTLIWKSVHDKVKFAEDLINSGADSLNRVIEAINNYIPNEAEMTSSLFTDDFEAYEIMSEPLYGRGKTIGPWKSSYIFAGYNDENLMQITADPQNSGNKVLRLRGRGTNYQSCVDLTADLTAIDGGHAVTADIYRVGSGDYIFGIRMMVNSYELDYYQLLFPRHNGKPLLQKVSDGDVILTNTMSGNIAGDTWYNVRMEVSGGLIRCEINDMNGTPVSRGSLADSDPFSLTQEEAKIRLLAQGDSGECYFDNISVSRTGVDHVTESTEQAVFADVMRDASITIARNAKTDSGYICDGNFDTVYSASSSYFIADLGGEYPLSVLKLEGLQITSPLTITASADYNSTAWSQIAVITTSAVQNGTASVFLSDQKTPYRYLKVTSSRAYQIGEMQSLCRLDGRITAWRCGEPMYINILPQDGEISAYGAEMDVHSNVLIPRAEGETRISVTKNDISIVNGYINALPACTAQEADGEINFRTGIEKQGEDITFYIAFYDSNGRLISVQSPSAAAKNSNIRFAELTAEQEPGCAYYKLMCWDMENGGIKPLSDTYVFSKGG